MPDVSTTRLYRPVGEEELALIEATGYRRFPPRLPEQPIFYPVLSFEYAEQIARDWNARDGKRGFVTAFDVPVEYLAKYDVQQVGGRGHLEYWIPAEELDAFNDRIVGTIEVLRTYEPV